MTPKERLEAVFNGKVPDKVPHFELDFQIPEQAFGVSFPDLRDYHKITTKDQDKLREEFFDIWDLVIQKYQWSAITVPDIFLKQARKRFEDKVLLYSFNGQGTFWMPSGNDMMDFVVKLFERPNELHEEAKIKKENSIELAKKQVDAGADFICINSDYGFNEGPFISPKMFSEFVTPYLTEVVDAIHKLGVKAILHSDGDLRKILDQLVSTGLDGYQSIDPQGHMDIAKVKEKYGNELILMGNVKTSALQDTNKEIIHESVQYCMKYGKPNGRYIFSTSNCIFDGMPLESYHIMLEEYEKLAYYH